MVAWKGAGEVVGLGEHMLKDEEANLGGQDAEKGGLALVVGVRGGDGGESTAD